MFIIEYNNKIVLGARVARFGTPIKSRLNPMRTLIARSYHKWYYIHRYLPSSVRIESSTLCQLKCTGCSFQAGGSDNLGRGYLTLENFKRFIAMNPFVKKVELSNYGEPFLNPNLTDIIYFAYENGVELTLDNGSNFNSVDEDQMRAMVETNFRSITLSIDGASQEIYSQYRVGGDFDTVIANVRKLQSIKKASGSEFPRLRWQYVLMEHNELEVGKAKKLATELGIPISFKLNWDPSYIPVHRDYLQRETELTELTEAEYASTSKEHPYGWICKQMFLNPQINWDGRLLGCCTQHYATFDVNVFEIGLKDALRSPKYMLAKKCLLATHPDAAIYTSCTCFNCKVRKQREASGIALEL